MERAGDVKYELLGSVRGATRPELDLLRAFRRAKTGFLSCKIADTSMFMSDPSYVMYWLVLSESVLSMYVDETQSVSVLELRLHAETQVHVEEMEYSPEDSKMICAVTENDKVKFLFSSRDIELCKAWRSSILQAAARESSGEEVDESLPASSDLAESEVFKDGFLTKYRKSAIYSRWVISRTELRDNTVQCWFANSKVDSADRPSENFLALHAFSRVDWLPQEVPGENRFFVSVKRSGGTYHSWRFASPDKGEAAEWIDAINKSIQECQVRYAVLGPSDLCGKTTSESTSERDLEDYSDPANCPVLYERDPTLMASIMQRVRRKTSVDRENFKRFYLSRFCYPVIRGHCFEGEHAVGTENVIRVIVYENQRFLPIGVRRGFNALNLVMGMDPPKLSDMDGVKFPDRYLKMAEPPDGFEWLLDSCAFSVDSTHTNTGEGGWTYASTFSQYREQYKNRCSIVDPSHSEAKTRRRRWFRDAHRIPSAVERSAAVVAAEEAVRALEGGSDEEPPGNEED